MTIHMKPSALIRRTMFENWWWISPLLGLAAAVWVVIGCPLPCRCSICTEPSERLHLLGAIIAAVLGSIFVVQQQVLAELSLFKQLFSEFNQRYDVMNDDLADIAGKGALDEKDRKRIVDYFNLCAEEYLFYREGHIQEEVWRSWCHGMLWYLKKPLVREAWDAEQKSDSYYGLNLAVIENGAAKSPSRRHARAES